MPGPAADGIFADRRSQNMSRIRSKDTGLEKTVPCMVHTMGYRYRLHRPTPNLPGWKTRFDFVLVSEEQFLIGTLFTVCDAARQASARMLTVLRDMQVFPEAATDGAARGGGDSFIPLINIVSHFCQR